MSQTERIFFIFNKIGRDGSVKASDVYKHFEVGDRTVKRDIEYIRDRLDVPLEWNPAIHAYTVDDSSEIPHLANVNEKLLVATALFNGLARSQGMSPILQEILSDSISDGLPDQYRKIQDKVIFTAPVMDLPPYETIDIFARALSENCTIRFDYIDAKGQASQRCIEPKRLINTSGRWYTVAYDTDKNALRVFHLARIKNPVLESVAYVHDLEDQLESFIGSAYGMFKGTEVHDVTIRITGDAANSVQSQIWHKDQKIVVKTTASGTPCLDITVPVSSYEEILSKVLSFGSSAYPLAPEQFVQMYRDEVRRMGE